MNSIIIVLFTAFCILNGLFWGFASHEQHCKLVSNFGVLKCPPHWVHVWVMSPLFFAMALFSHQGSAGLYNDLISMIKKTTA